MSLVRRLARPTVAVAAVATGYTAYTSSQPLLADDSAPRNAAGARPGRSSNGDKLPIYPAETEPLVTLVEADNPLTPYIAQARVATTDAMAGASAVVKSGVSKWIDFERKAEREIKTVLPADESLTPGIIYVLIAGLSGSVLTRTRAFPLRMLAPPLFTLAAMPYFLPKTAHNLRNYLSDVEDKYAPDLAEKHDILNSRLSMHWEMAKDKLGRAGQDASDLGSRAVKGIESTTGLRVGDLVKRGQEKVEEQKRKLEGAGVKMPREGVKMETVGYVVETKPVAEIVAPVGADSHVLGNAAARVERPSAVRASTEEEAVRAVKGTEALPIHAEEKAAELKDKAEDKATQLKGKVEDETAQLKAKAEEKKVELQKKAEEGLAKAKEAGEKVKEKAKAAMGQVTEKVKEETKPKEESNRRLV